ncbi:hypothetical protein T07_7781 [Trichinella nelsoni]|uniref:Uncharacterized protein n=1 Tax=Trichinella nelsoni TaxID=6336 RepID=A0A0V0S2N0_9BILA|nr:hypothetical protein T07_7781 [Trichinella nelsoni]
MRSPIQMVLPAGDATGYYPTVYKSQASHTARGIGPLYASLKTDGGEEIGASIIDSLARLRWQLRVNWLTRELEDRRVIDINAQQTDAGQQSAQLRYRYLNWSLVRVVKIISCVIINGIKSQFLCTVCCCLVQIEETSDFV